MLPEALDITRMRNCHAVMVHGQHMRGCKWETSLFALVVHLLRDLRLLVVQHDQVPERPNLVRTLQGGFA